MIKKYLSLLRVCLLSVFLLSGQAGFAANIDVAGGLSSTVNWTRNNTYVLNGLVYVLDGAVLNIEAGTVIKAKRGTDANTSALIVTRGGKIFANGTAQQPIIFTSEEDDVTDPNDLPLYERGLWGGVVILGKSVLNTATDAAGNAASPKYDVFEGMPDTQISGQFVNRFGGNDDNDNSGVFRYVSIRHAGVVFQPNKELNGLSLGAVGRGTTIEYVETYATADDGYEFFGGTVNTKYLVSAFNDDDAFDIDQGYRGKNQFWFSIQEPGRKDHGGEWNGEPNGIAVGAQPVANYEIYNATFIGSGTNTSGNRAFIVREYAAPKLYNSIVTDFAGFGVNIDARSAEHLASGVLDIRDNIWWQIGRGLAEGTNAPVLFSDTARNNMSVDPMLRGISRTNNFGLDPRPAAGSPALSTSRAPSDSFYTQANYKGAFGGINWAADWTFLSDASVLSGAGGGVPITIPVTSPPAAPRLALSIGNGGIQLSFVSEAGKAYQVQTSSDLVNWTNIGDAPMTGSGSALSYQDSIGSSVVKFYRVIAQ